MLEDVLVGEVLLMFKCNQDFQSGMGWGSLTTAWSNVTRLFLLFAAIFYVGNQLEIGRFFSAIF